MNERLLKRGCKNNCDKTIYEKSSWYNLFTTNYLQHSVQYRRVTRQRSKIYAFLVFLMPKVSTGPGAHPPFYSKRTVRVTSREKERTGREVNHSIPSSNEGKIEWNHDSTPPYMPLCRGQGQLHPWTSSFSHDKINRNIHNNIGDKSVSKINFP